MRNISRKQLSQRENKIRSRYLSNPKSDSQYSNIGRTLNIGHQSIARPLSSQDKHTIRIMPSDMFRTRINVWKYDPFRHFDKTPCKGDRPIARSLPTQDSTAQHRKNAGIRVYGCFEWDSNPQSQCFRGSKSYALQRSQPPRMANTHTYTRTHITEKCTHRTRFEFLNPVYRETTISSRSITWHW
jgi:hypothetical protein